MSLKKMVISGAKYTTFSSLFLIFLQIFRLSILARLLDPSSFGLMGMVTVVIGLSQIFSDMGISNAIIQKQKVSSRELATLYWFNFFTGILVTLILILLTPFIISFYKEPDLKEIIYILALTFLIAPVGQQFQFLLQKELEFKKLSLIEISASIINTVLSILLAVLEFEVLSLAFGQLAESITKSMLLFFVGLKRWGISFSFNIKDLKKFIHFGLFQMGERYLNYIYSNVDFIVIGKFLGPTALGYYTLAYNLIILPSMKINPILTKISFPLFSRIQNDQIKLKEAFLKLMKIVGYINFPVFIGLFVVAQDLILTFYGRQWEPSIPLLKILIGVGLLRSLGNPVGSLYMAKGRVDLGFKFNLYKMIVHIPIIVYVSMKYGVVGVAFTFLILQLLYFCFNYTYIIKNILGKVAMDYAESLFPSLRISILMGGIVWIFSLFLHAGHLSIKFVLVLEVFIGIAVYALLFFKINKEDYYEAKKLINNKLS